MALTTIYPNGVSEITVPATESIAISNFGGGIAKIYYLINQPNYPQAYQFQQTLEDSSVTLGAFASETIVKIESGASKVIYDVATAPDTGIGDADTLGGELPSYYATDSLAAHLAGPETLTGQKVFSYSTTNYAIRINTTNDRKIELSGSDNPRLDFLEGAALKFYLQWHSSGYVYLYNFETSDAVRIGGANGIEFAPDSTNYETIYHTGINPSLGSGDGVTGSFTTSDAKTVTVTDGIITAIV